MNDLSKLLTEYKKKGNLLTTLTQLKSVLSTNELGKLTTNKILKRLSPEIWGPNTFPKVWDINEKAFATYFTGNLVLECKYLIAACIAHQEELSRFEDLKEKYETEILNGSIEAANNILKEIEEKFGESLWLINSKLFCAERKGGTEENWKLLADLTRERNDSLVRLLIENKSRLNESNIKYTDYLRTTENSIKKFPIDNKLRTFLRFESNVTFPITTEGMAMCAYMYTCMPIIDRYNTLSKLFKLFYCNLASDDLKGVYYQIKHFNKAFPNHTIARNILILEGHLKLTPQIIDFNYIELIDTLYRGKKPNSQEYILKQFTDKFSFKHYIDLQAYFTDIEPHIKNESLHAEILTLIGRVNAKQQDFGESLLSLKKLSVQLAAFNSVTYLEYFVDKENSLDNTYSSDYLRMIIDEKFIPIDSTLSAPSEKVKNIQLSILGEIEHYPELFEILNAIEKNDYEYLSLIIGRCTELEFAYGSCLCKLKSYKDAAESFKRIMQSDSNYFISFAILELIECYAQETLSHKLCKV